MNAEGIKARFGSVGASAAVDRAGAPVICFPFAGGIAGGSHISVIKLIRSLDRQRFTPLIIVHHEQGEVADMFRREGLAFERAPVPYHFGHAAGIASAKGPGRLLRAVAAQLRLARFLRARRVRIVHTNEGPMHATWALPARLAGARLLWHHRATPDARGLKYLAPLLADRIVSVSRFALSQSPLARAAHCSVVYSPFDADDAAVDRESARRVLIAELGVSADTRIVGFFGNLVDRKRPLVFVDAIAAMARRAPAMPVVGVMFGAVVEGALDAAVRERAREAGIAGRVRLMGFRYPGLPWLSACDVHAVTAVDEPFGRSLIEAMLIGTPVVAVASGGNSEAICDGVNGLLTPPDDAEAMAGRILELLGNPAEAMAMAARACADARAGFGRERHARVIAGIYDELLTRRGESA